MLCGGGVPTAMAACLKWLLRIAVVGGIAFLSLGLFFIVGCLLVAVFALKLISSSEADDSSQNSASIQSVDTVFAPQCAIAKAGSKGLPDLSTP
jgi:hypothetical protein